MDLAIKLIVLLPLLAAAIAAYFAIKQPGLVEFAKTNVPYLEKEVLAQIGVGAAAFLLVLIIVSIISVKISDLVVDSSVGAFDRTLKVTGAVDLEVTTGSGNVTVRTGAAVAVGDKVKWM